jgi:hypothetical protein
MNFKALPASVPSNTPGREDGLLDRDERRKKKQKQISNKSAKDDQRLLKIMPSALQSPLAQSLIDTLVHTAHTGFRLQNLGTFFVLVSQGLGFDCNQMWCKLVWCIS